MRLVLLGFLAFAACSAGSACPDSLYWNPSTCRCHSSASGGFAPTACCLRENVNTDACIVPEDS